MDKEKKEKLVEMIQEGYQLNLSDFALFLSVMKNKRAYECTLSIILGEPELEFPSARFNPPPLGGQALAAFPSRRNCGKIQH